MPDGAGVWAELEPQQGERPTVGLLLATSPFWLSLLASLAQP